MISLHPFEPILSDISVSAEIQIGRQRTKKVNSSVLIKGKFVVSDKNDEILWPPRKANYSIVERKNEIWKSTCFELFLKNPNYDNYFEFNLNSVGAWNLYYFTSYRTPQPPTAVLASELKAFTFDPTRSSLVFELQIELPKPALVEFFAAEYLMIGLNSIIQTKDQEKIYFATYHPSHKPDFHLSDGFSIRSDIHEF